LNLYGELNIETHYRYTATTRVTNMIRPFRYVMMEMNMIFKLIDVSRFVSM
jgi:hypothetical protein